MDTGCGDFKQPIKLKSKVEVGQIPAGKDHVKIYLYSDVDVDVQLIDSTTDEAFGLTESAVTCRLAGPRTAGRFNVTLSQPGDIGDAECDSDAYLLVSLSPGFLVH